MQSVRPWEAARKAAGSAAERSKADKTAVLTSPTASLSSWALSQTIPLLCS